LYDFFGEKDFILSIQKYFNLDGYDNDLGKKLDYSRVKVLTNSFGGSIFE